MTQPRPSRLVAAGLDQGVRTCLRWMSIACLVVLLVLVSAIVLVRFFPVVSLGWADEVVEFAFAWMVFLGTAALWSSNEHITIDFIPQALAGTRLGQTLEVLVCVLALAFLAVFVWQGTLLTWHALSNHTPLLDLPKSYWYAAIPVSGLVMIAYTVHRGLNTIQGMRRDRQVS